MSGQDDLWAYLREPSRGKPALAFVPEPEAVRLAAIVAAWERHADSFLGPSLLPGAIRAEVRLAEIEGRQAREFTIAQETQRVPPSVSQPPRPPAPPPIIEGEFERMDECPSHDFVEGICKCGARQVDGFEATASAGPDVVQTATQAEPAAEPVMTSAVQAKGIWPYATSGDEDDSGALTGAPHAEEPPPRTGDDLEW